MSKHVSAQNKRDVKRERGIKNPREIFITVYVEFKAFWTMFVIALVRVTYINPAAILAAALAS